MADQPGPIRCATYTHARRHPKVIGRIAGWTPPFQLTLTQVAVLLTTGVLMVQSWRFWAPALPSGLALLVGVGLPVGLTWAVRRWRAEGRPLARTALGWIALWSTPSRGTVLGHPYRDRRPVDLGGVRISVAEDPEAAPEPSRSRLRTSAPTPTNGGRFRPAPRYRRHRSAPTPAIGGRLGSGPGGPT